MRARLVGPCILALVLVAVGCGSSGPVDRAKSAAKANYTCDGHITVTRPGKRPGAIKDVAVIRCGPENWLSPLVGVWVYTERAPSLDTIRRGYDYGRFCESSSVVYYLYAGGPTAASKFCEQVGARPPIRARDGKR